MDFDLGKILLASLPILLAITVHEVAHGWVALKFGDRTAQMQGRLTLNPLKHVDPLGTVVMPILTLVFADFVFGWARPVPVDYRNLRNPRRDMIWIAAAGPGSNFVMALLWGWLSHLATTGMAGSLSGPLLLMTTFGVQINLGLMVLNLLPLPPLDGSRILMGLLPPRQAETVARLEPWGLFILLAMMATHTLNLVLLPLYVGARELLNLFI